MRICLAALAMAVLSCGFTGGPARAAELQLEVLERREVAPLDFEGLYLVEFHCDDRRGYPLKDFLRSLNSGTLGGILGTRTKAVTHGFVVSGSAPNVAPANDFTLAGVDGPVVPMHVFSFSDGPGNADTVFDRRQSCDMQLFLRGGASLYITPFIRHSVDTAPPVLANAVATAATAIGPLFTLFTGEALHASVTTRVTEVGNLVTTYKQWLALFTGDGSRTKPLGLFEGSMTIQTGASNIYVRVTRVNSLLLHPRTKFRGAYESFFDKSQGSGITAGDVAGTCETLAKKLIASGLRASSDVAYVLYNEVVKVTSDKKKIVECLGLNHARSALENIGLFIGIPRALLIAQEDIDAHAEMLRTRREEAEEAERDRIAAELQPEIDLAILNNILEFREIGRRRIVTGRIFTEDEARLAEVAKDRIVLLDRTPDVRIFGPEAKSGRLETGPMEAIAKLADAGYTRLQCYALTRIHDDLNRRYDGAGVMMLAFKASDDGKLYRDDAVGLRILVEDEKVSQIRVSDLFVDAFRKHVTGCPIVDRPQPEVSDRKTDGPARS